MTKWLFDAVLKSCGAELAATHELMKEVVRYDREQAEPNLTQRDADALETRSVVQVRAGMSAEEWEAFCREAEIRFLRALGRLVRDPASDPFVRVDAVEWLGRAVPPGDVAVETLVAALRNDPLDFVRAAAAQALGRLGPGAAAADEALREGEADANREVARASAEARKRLRR